MKKTNKKSSVKRVVKTNARPRRGRRLLRRARFLPALVIAGFATFLSLQPVLQSMHSGVLSYATNMSPAGLLSSTNSQRAANGVANLSANSLLSAAAQVKAEDMVARNYWSHVTPDGKQPWVFVTNAGYQYSSAGENLAYGFMTSNDAVIGWMNSPPHKANLLSATFTEVGFGIANSPSYVGDGEQTIVVAMYGKPLAAAAPAASKPVATKPVAAVPKPAAETAPAPVEISPAPAPEEEVISANAESETETQPVSAAPASVQRVQTLGNGFADWSVTLVILAAVSTVLLWMIHKGVHFKRYFVAGERFVFNHIHLDLTVIAIVFLASVLLTRTGVIR